MRFSPPDFAEKVAMILEGNIQYRYRQYQRLFPELLNKPKHRQRVCQHSDGYL